jgi:hypothetical protein
LQTQDCVGMGTQDEVVDLLLVVRLALLVVVGVQVDDVVGGREEVLDV